MTTKALQLIDVALPIGNLEAYIQHVNRIPILSAEKEHTLATRFYEKNDLRAAQELVLAHLRFVVKIAKNYVGYGLSLSDLVQEGNVGLMKAVKRFDPKVGVRLVSFAVHWIKAEIHEFILRNFRVVKIATTKAQRKLFFNLRKLRKHIGWLSKSEIEDIANTLNVKPKTVAEMEARLNYHDTAFDVYNNDDEEQYLAPAQYLTNPSDDPANLFEKNDFEEDSKQKLYEAFNKLDSRSQTIIKKRWLANEKATLQELAEEYKISAERVRQLEQQAIKKLKKLIKIYK